MYTMFCNMGVVQVTPSQLWSKTTFSHFLEPYPKWHLIFIIINLEKVLKFTLVFIAAVFFSKEALIFHKFISFYTQQQHSQLILYLGLTLIDYLKWNTFLLEGKGSLARKLIKRVSSIKKLR